MRYQKVLLQNDLSVPDFADRKPSFQVSKSSAKFSAMYEGPQQQKNLRSKDVQTDKLDNSVTSEHTKFHSRDQSKINDGEGLVRRLIGELSEHQQTKALHQKSSLSHFVQGLSLGHTPSTHQQSKDTPHSQTLAGVNGVLKSLFETTSVAFQKSDKTTETKTSNKTTQEGGDTPKQISFGNINIIKTVEEMIKRSIIQSKSAKYSNHNINEYFRVLKNAVTEEMGNLADMQKQALFTSTYHLLHKQLVIEVTLEMIKDAGVNIQHLFQTTFARLGLDYDKYIQYENQKDQDLSARSIYEGDLDCTLEDPISNSETERNPQKAGKHKNSFNLNFQALYTSQEQPPAAH